MKRPQLLTAVAALLLGFYGRGECQAQTTWVGSDPATVAAATAGSDENTVFLYNVSTGKFLNTGGFWGVAAVTSDIGVEFTVTSETQQSGRNTTTVYIFKTKMLAQNASTSGAFQEIETCLTFDNNEKQYVLDRSVSQATSDTQNRQYYGAFTLTSATDGYTFKANNRYMAAGQASDAKNIVDTSNPITGFSTQPSTGGVWKLVTLKERKQAFMKASNETKNYVPGTFLILDNDFSRRNAYISSWKGGSTALSYATNTVNEGAVTPSAQTLTYYVGNGAADSENNSANWTGNTKGASTDLNQTVNPFRHGWYEIRCRAFTTSTSGSSVLYAKVGDATQKVTAKTEYAEAAITQTNAPSSYDAANTEVNKSATATDGSTYYPYEVVVRVYVPKTGTEGGELGTDGTYSYETCQTLTFGVKNNGGAANDWICVDHFELEYLGEGTQAIVLDETQPGIDYINEQVNGKNSTIYLNRSFTANAWNSVVLPFDMSNSDIIDIFGSGTKVSKYVGAKDNDKTTIYFEGTTAIEAGKLYIIKPTVGEPDNGEISVSSEKTLTLSTMDMTTGNVTTNSEKQTLSIKGKYYTIPNIVFGKLDSENNEPVKFTETVTGDTKEVVADGAQYTFAGTYVKKMNVIPLYSYRINALNSTDHTGSEDKWVVNTGAKAHSLGFRGWLQKAAGNTSSGAAKLSFVIDGIEDETTAIEGITTDAVVKTQTRGIYNLNGQLVSNDATQLQSLPKGLYIVNGKKVVVR